MGINEKLLEACRAADLEEVKRLIDAGADVYAHWEVVRYLMSKDLIKLNKTTIAALNEKPTKETTLQELKNLFK